MVTAPTTKGPTMAAEILERSMAERRRSTIGWFVGVAVYTLINVAVFPEVKSQSGLNDLIKEYPPALMSMMGIDAKTLDITSAVGYLGSQMNMIGPLLLVMVGVAFGSATLAGEEEDGTLALALSYPVSRTRVLVEKGAALLLVVAFIALGLLFTILAGRLFELDVPIPGLVAFCVSLALLGALFGMVALAVGAATGSKAMGTGVAAALAGATYLVSSLAPVVSVVRPLRWASPFWYATGGNPLANGLAIRDVVVLVSATSVLWLSSVALFNRRDLRG